MATVTKLEELNAVSLQLTRPASKIVDLTPVSDGDASRAAAFDMIYKLLLLIGENMSKMQQANSQTNLNQSHVAESQSKATQVAAQDQVKKLDDYIQQLQEQAKWGPLFIFFKVLAAVVSAVIAVFSCGTAAGLLLSLVVIALTCSPAFDHAVAGIASALEADGVDSGTAKIIADVIMTVVVAVLSFGTEAIGGALQAGTSAAEAGTEAAVSAASTIARGASSISASSAEAIISAIISSNFITDLIDKIPGAKKIPIISVVISILVQVIALFAAGKFAAGNSDTAVITSLSKKLTPELLQKLTPALGLISGFANTGSGIGEGVMGIKQSNIQKEIAPLQALLGYLAAYMQTWTQLTSQSQKSMQSSINNYANIFDINFSRDMQACVAAQYQG